MSGHDPPGKPQVYKLRSNCSYCLMEKLPIISKNQNKEKPRGKLPKRTKIITDFSIQETGKYILLNANTKVNTPAGRKKIASEREFTTLTGIREIRYERDFLCFLEEVQVMYDVLKSISNLIKTVAELPMLEKTEDMVNHLMKALGTVANSVSNVQ
ncbi:hypothetical protein AVEN_260513-1 [Araneus ventricosus]|uniref:Uncharacterized protein n=1 Tax=Araneus ventricosus TaxID=182803 RepID=A0A4Y2H4S6_ARAVE|nr:hypothetical protein AVEN_260513-1 [Araneus ventricosus]